MFGRGRYIRGKMEYLGWFSDSTHGQWTCLFETHLARAFGSKRCQKDSRRLRLDWSCRYLLFPARHSVHHYHGHHFDRRHQTYTQTHSLACPLPCSAWFSIKSTDIQRWHPTLPIPHLITEPQRVSKPPCPDDRSNPAMSTTTTATPILNLQNRTRLLACSPLFKRLMIPLSIKKPLPSKRVPSSGSSYVLTPGSGVLHPEFKQRASFN
jgi:hypothetical protein